MHIYQISVFLENRSGQLAEIAQLLADNNIDIRAISIAETSDYGLARMIVDDSERASSILLQHGVVLSMTPVVAVEVPHRPAGLSEVLNVLKDNNITVEYMYSLFTHKTDTAYMILRISDQTVLNACNLKLVNAEELGLK